MTEITDKLLSVLANASIRIIDKILVWLIIKRIQELNEEEKSQK